MSKQIKIIRNTITLKEGIKEFILYKRANNLSIHTLDYYEECFKNFTRFVDENELIRNINQETIKNWVLLLQKQGLKDTAINSKIRGIRAIMYYFSELGYLEKFKISVMKEQEYIKEIYTENELKLLTKKPDIKKCDFVEYRSWVIVNTLIGTGMRLNTLINIKIKDVDLNNDLLIYRTTKNRKQQVVPISSSLALVLTEYINVRKNQGAADSDFFLLIDMEIK